MHLSELILGITISNVFLIVCGSKVCFDELGCFPLGEPWSSATRPVPPPQGPNIVVVNFHLYTRQNPNNSYTIRRKPKRRLLDSFYDGRKKTLLYIHGYKGSGNDPYVIKMKNALLQSVDANVFTVDYGSSSFNLYTQVVANTRVIGAQVASFCHYLINYEGASAYRLHLIGMSLGAHIAGYAGKRIPGLARITGLDPAQPLFEGESKEVRLDKEDAAFVDIAHTNGRPTIPFLGFGFYSQIGHVDFYFNGGLSQPGCASKEVDNALTKLYRGDLSVVIDIPLAPFCSHFRVRDFYIEALSNPNCTFWGMKRRALPAEINILTFGWLSRFHTSLNHCTLKTCLPFGPKIEDYPARGSFEIATSSTVPYCIKSRKVDESMERQLVEHRSQDS